MLEESRLISRLDCHVIEEVAKLLRYQMDNHFPMVPVSVNLSRYDFLLMDPLAFVERIVEQYHIPRYYLRIEVTESALVKNRHLLIEKLHQFHQSGYQVWLDDFGSAYSSLNACRITSSTSSRSTKDSCATSTRTAARSSAPSC